MSSNNTPISWWWSWDSTSCA
ncbi:Protein of unknown function [Pyronema omphalodes CBS 100304]|uniref:Uncharacterized protein n=1 Tax=Pyronema omphalodes (strain CBS 100304) TaxID=1076935 RepID=U4LVS6_PYROM|nr:Protein of unknown function [Pyronema omphalodes CBS 100304]